MIFGVTLLTSAQETLLASGAVSDWEVGKTDTISADSKENALIFSGKGNVRLLSKIALKIDPSKSYRVSGMFKLGSGSAPSSFYFGLSPINDKGNQITTNQIYFIKGTETELADECYADDAILKIKNGENWKTGQHYCIAFETDDSGKYTDLPNTKLSSSGIVKVEKRDGVYEVTMQGRCRAKYPVGTKIRLHSAGAGGIYTASSGKIVPTEWTEFKRIVKPAVIDTMNLQENWWPGTEKVKYLITFSSEKPDSEISVLFKDLKLEEVK